MGVINHNVVIGTTWSEEEFNYVGEWVGNLKPELSALFVTNKNKFGDITIIMTPDGSKDGWEDSNECDKLREEFINLLDSRACEDDSNAWKYVEVSFGECGQSIVKGNNKDMYQ